MLNVMLCGAADTGNVREMFRSVTADFGAEAWSYLSGEIRYANTATADWVENSRLTVEAADICVFVIVERYGEITWTHELDRALDSGTPFILLCLADTYTDYLTLKRNVAHLELIDDEDKRNLVSTLTDVESVRQLTVVQYTFGNFAEIYRRELAKLFDEGVRALSTRYEREAIGRMLDEPERLRSRQLATVEDIALDEFEDKVLRKRAVAALATRGAAGEETVARLVASGEQGVQRLAVERLPDLCAGLAVDVDFLRECVSLANRSDDVGVVRRLIPALFAFGAEVAVAACAAIDLGEVGTRRRLADAIEAHEPDLATDEARRTAAAILARCVEPGLESDWKERARVVIDRLQQPSVG